MVHLEGSSVFVPYIKSLELENLVIASPDVGGAARARNFAKFFNADIIPDSYKHLDVYKRQMFARSLKSCSSLSSMLSCSFLANP